jgi:hypothetical protein
MKLYFDTCVWIRKHEDVNPEESRSIDKIVEWGKSNKLSIVTSTQVKKELKDLIIKKGEQKFIDALKTMKEHGKEFLAYPAFILDDPVKGVLGLSKLGDNQKFQESQLSSQDKDVAEFLVDNDVDVFVSVDGHFTKTQIVEDILKDGRLKVLNPIDFVKAFKDKE